MSARSVHSLERRERERAETRRDFLEAAFGTLDLDYRDFVEFDTKYTRPSEVDVLLGDASKARKVLGWKPDIDFSSLVKMMIEHDLELARREKYAQGY